MSYTNGFNKTQVLTSLVGRLGWSDASLNETNRGSRSGRYFDDGSFHSLVTVSNIKATAPTQADWDAYFSKKQEAAILKCLNGVFSGAEYLEQHLSLYERTSEQTETVSNSSLFCGYKIEVANASDIAVQLNSASLLFDGAVTFNLYVFKSGNVAPIKTISVSSVENEATEVSLADFYLKHPGTYYVGYFQSDLGVVKAIREQVRFYRTNTFGAKPFTAQENGADFERTALSYTGQPYGLNLSVSAFRDYTTAIKQQAHLFDEVIGMTLEFMVLESMLNSLNSSSTERKIKEALDAAGLNLYLYGVAPISDGPKAKGLNIRLQDKLKEVKAQFYKPSKAHVVSLC